MKGRFLKDDAQKLRQPELVRQAVLGDSYLSSVFASIYRKMLETGSSNHVNMIVEIGSGASLIKFLVPEAHVITTDLIFDFALDLVCDGSKLPFKDASIDLLLLKDTLHHIASITDFINECQRVLKKGARVVLFEPYWGLLAQVVYRFFHHEAFDTKQLGWNAERSDTWDSNQAIPWILLRRDRQEFEKSMTDFQIEDHGTALGVRYLLSGGVFNRSLIHRKIMKGSDPLRGVDKKWSHHFQLYICFSFRKSSVET
jgi:SAM-dependent methyltransferase